MLDQIRKALLGKMTEKHVDKNFEARKATQCPGKGCSAMKTSLTRSPRSSQRRNWTQSPTNWSSTYSEPCSRQIAPPRTQAWQQKPTMCRRHWIVRAPTAVREEQPLWQITSSPLPYLQPKPWKKKRQVECLWLDSGYKRHRFRKKAERNRHVVHLSQSESEKISQPKELVTGVMTKIPLKRSFEL